MSRAEGYTYLYGDLRLAQEYFENDERNEAQEESINKMWSEYLGDVEEFDKDLTEDWKADANSVLTFTAIFSATVATFIVESYKMLSPDSGKQTVFLLGQLSQQFAGFANGTYLQPQTPPQPPPSASVVCLNSIWLLSLMLSTTSALFAILTQQWARRYLQLPQTRSVPRERARLRSFLFLGTINYAMLNPVEIAPMFLHLSVFLFNIGLVLFFFMIYKPVALVVLVSVMLFGMAYFVVTILPCFDHICPYFTPLSSISWYLWHAFASLTKSFFRRILKYLHTLLVPYSLGDIETGTRIQAKLTVWLNRIEHSLKRHRQRLKDGFRGSIVKNALEAPHNIDVKMLAWLFQLPALADKDKVESIVAVIPKKMMIHLWTIPFEHGKITFPGHLLALLRSCAPGTVGLDEDMRKRRLSVCLDAVHHIARASIIPYGVELTPSLLSDLYINFANVPLMRALWADENPAICVTARSICALLARQLLRKSWLKTKELAWLQEVLEKPANTISNHRKDLVDSMNIDSFVCGVLSYRRYDLPIPQAITFADTLAILMNSGRQTALRSDTFRDQLSSLNWRVVQGDHEDRDNIVNKLHRMFPRMLPTPTRSNNHAPRMQESRRDEYERVNSQSYTTTP